jgi:predicted DNA-binding protein YlxM (UPF0122 family)
MKINAMLGKRMSLEEIAEKLNVARLAIVDMHYMLRPVSTHE